MNQSTGLIKTDKIQLDPVDEETKKLKEPSHLYFYREEIEEVWFFVPNPDALELAEDKMHDLLQKGWTVQIKKTDKRVTLSASRFQKQHALVDRVVHTKFTV